MKKVLWLLSFGTLVVVPSLCLSAFASSNSGAPSSASREETESRNLSAYNHVYEPSELGTFEIEAVSLGRANLALTEVRDTACGNAESGDLGCIQKNYKQEAAVLVRISVVTSQLDGEHSGADSWIANFRMRDFNPRELAEIQEIGVGFDPFGSRATRSREVARQLFQVSVRPAVKTWKEAVFGTQCRDESSGGEHVTRVCNVIGSVVRTRTVNTLIVSKR